MSFSNVQYQANLQDSTDPAHKHLSNNPSHNPKIMVNFSLSSTFLFIKFDFVSAALFSTLITRCAKDIDHLIDSLPSDEVSQDLQVHSLQVLEEENRQESERLEEVVKRGEDLLEKIQAALSEIAKHKIQYDS